MTSDEELEQETRPALQTRLEAFTATLGYQQAVNGSASLPPTTRSGLPEVTPAADNTGTEKETRPDSSTGPARAATGGPGAP
jgi:hypothetical protein